MERAFSPDERLPTIYLAEIGRTVKMLPEMGSGRRADALAEVVEQTGN
ncbi:MAG: hypothetical protein RML95_01150 [Anaerolineae bacterium]|nr:hypothetical protein [Anaerolineae bacterium]